MRLMPLFVIGVLFIYSWAPMAADSSATRPAPQDPLMRIVTDAEIKQKSLAAIVIGLGQEVGINVNVEDNKSNSDMSICNAEVTDYAVKGMTFKDVLEYFTKKTGKFTWSHEGNIVNLTSSAIKNNPFDEHVKPLKFKGTSDQFIRLMNAEVKSLGGFHVVVLGSHDNAATVVFETKEPLLLRQVFNRFANEAGLRWYAQIDDSIKGRVSTELMFFKENDESKPDGSK